MAQIGNFSSVNLSAFMKIKNSTVPIGTPASDFVGVYSFQDSLHFKNDTGRDWNLGAMPDVAKIFKKEITVNGENNIKISFPLTTTTKVFYNGSMIENTRWAKLGTDTISLYLDTMIYDVLIIHN